MKQKLWKKIVSILLVLCMILPVMPANPVTVKAKAGDAVDTIEVSWNYTGSGGNIYPRGVRYGRNFASGTTAGNPEVGEPTKSTAGWYWDGNGNFYMTNCTLNITGNDQSNSTEYYLLLFQTDNLTVHLKGKNKIILLKLPTPKRCAEP